MTKSRAAAVAFAMLLAIGGLNTYLSLKSKAESRKRQRETHALAVSNCRNNATLAKIERAFINRQETQSRALLESGVTFGIPPDKLPALIQASRDSQTIFLNELDTLAFANCPLVHPVAPALVVPGSKPGKRSKPGRKTTRQRGGKVPSAAVPSGAHGVTGAAASTGSEPSASGALGRGSGGGPGAPSTTTSPSSQAPATSTASSPPSTTAEQPTPTRPSPPPTIPVEVPRTISVPVPCLKADGTLTVC